MDRPEARVAEWKKKEVQVIKDFASRYKLIGIVDLSGLPGSQLLKIKSGVRDFAELRMARKSLIKIALKETGKPNIDVMVENVKGKAALLFTNEDAFKIFKILKKNIAYTKAKAGQIAPMDIVIKAGPTSFLPGPMIGELGRVGLKTGVEGGKIAIKEDKLLVKKGDVINAVNADLLTKFGVEPMEVGLKLMATYDNGEILMRDVLDVNEDEIINSLVNITYEAVLFAVEIGYAVKDTIEQLIIKGYREADALGNGLKLDMGDTKAINEDVKDEPVEDALEAKKEEPAEIQETNNITNEEDSEEIKPPIVEEEKIQEVEKSNENVEGKPEEIKEDVLLDVEKKGAEEISDDLESEANKEDVLGNISEDVGESIRMVNDMGADNVEEIIEEQAKKAADLRTIDSANAVDETVKSIIGGKTLNTNAGAFQTKINTPLSANKVQNQATINFERDSQVAADFLRKVTDMKIKSQARKS